MKTDTSQLWLVESKEFAKMSRENIVHSLNAVKIAFSRMIQFRFTDVIENFLVIFLVRELALINRISSDYL